MEISLKEAKEIIKKYPEVDSFIDAHFRQWTSGHNEYCDNSFELSEQWNKCMEIIKNDKNKYEIIYKNDKPYGIRDSTGFLLFFTDITKYPDQEERYQQEIAEQFELADYLLKCLKNK